MVKINLLQKGVFGALFSVSCLLNVANAGVLDTLNHYNLIVFDNLQSNSEVEGRTLVGGSLIGDQYSNYGIHLPNNNATDYALTVAGNIDANINVQSGYSVLKGGGNGIINNAASVDNFSTQAAQLDLTQLASDLYDFSQFLKDIAPNSILDARDPNNNFGPAPGTFQIGSSVGNDVAVFSTSNDLFFANGNIQQYDIDFNGQQPSSILINVAGTDINDSVLGNAVGSFASEQWRDKVIWNFFEATNINLQKSLNGSLLAPLAHLTNTTTIEGTVVVNSFQQQGEVHLATFSGTGLVESTVDIPEPVVDVPEPNSRLLMVFSLLGLICFARTKV